MIIYIHLIKQCQGYKPMNYCITSVGLHFIEYNIDYNMEMQSKFNNQDKYVRTICNTA